jgi:tape measure domain-containing protein
MADTIGTLAYRVKFDASQLTQGLMSTRQQMSAARKMTESMASPLEKYVNGLTNLNLVIQRNLDLEKHRIKFENQLERAYLQEASAIRVLTKEEQKRLELLTLSDRVGKGIKSQQTGVGSGVVMDYHDRNRGRGMARQSFFAGIDQQAEAGRAALQERLARFKGSGTMASARARSPLISPQETFQNMPQFTQELEKSSSAMNGLALGAKAFVGFKLAQYASNAANAIGELRRESVQMYASVEGNTKVFEAFTGRATMATTIMSDLRALAPQVGTSFAGLQDAARGLMAYGVKGPDIVDRLRELSIITLGDTERLKSMALAYGQVVGNTKLMGQERLQFTNAGFNPLVEISRTSGMGIPELTKMMEDGKLSADMVTKALNSATSAGGMFGDVIEKTADTTMRAMNRSKAAWDMAKTDIGEAMKPLTIWYSGVSSKVADELSMHAKTIGGIFGSTKSEIAEDAKAIDKREKAIAKENERLKERKRIEDAFKAQAEEKKANKDFGLKNLIGYQTEEYKSDPNMNKNTIERAERLFGLMDGNQKEMAMQDFTQFRNVDTLMSYLDKELAAEVRNTEAIIAKNKQLEIQKELREEGDKITRRHSFDLKDNELGFANDLGRLQMLLKNGAIGQDVFNKERDRLAKDSSSYKPVQAPSSIAAGSQEAYKQMVAGQLRGENKMLKEQAAMKLIAKTALAAQQEQVRLQKELNEKMDFESVGG